MGDTSIFSVFSNIWSSVRLKITPQFQASWKHRLFTLDMGSLKKNDSFSFYLSISVLPVFLYLIAANNGVLLSLPNNVWRLIVFAPFLIIIKSPKQCLETYCFCSVSYYYYYVTPNAVG